MCHMVSVSVVGTERGLELLAAPDLISHMHIVWRYGIEPSENVYEVEWLEDSGCPSVRVPPYRFAMFMDYVTQWILSNWPTRERLISAAHEIASSPIPEHIAGRHLRRVEMPKESDENEFRVDYRRMWAIEAALAAPVAVIEQPIPVDVGWNSELATELFGKVEVMK